MALSLQKKPPLTLSKEGRKPDRTLSILRPAANQNRVPGERALKTAAPAAADVPELDEVLEGFRHYDGQGAKMDEQTTDGIHYLTNAFWRANAGGSHPLQKAPYHACYSGNLAECFISRLSNVGAVVHDPFLGRGTTALQSALMGRCASGSDINALSVLMTRPRLTQVTMEDIKTKVIGLDLVHAPIKNGHLLAYFHPSTLQDIEALRRALAEHAPLSEPNPDPVWDWIRMAVVFRLTGHTPAYLSRETAKPNEPTPSLTKQLRRNARTGLPAPERDIRQIILNRCSSFLRKGCIASSESHRLAVGAAWDTPWIPDASIDMVLMSPPFADVVDYKQDAWIRAWFAGVSLDNVAFAHHRSLTDWSAMIRRTLIEQIRIVKPGGYIAIEVGEIRKGAVDLERFVWVAAEGLPCRRICVVVNQQTFTKSAQATNATKGVIGTNSNRIVILKRH